MIYIENSSTNPYFNLAVEEYFMKKTGDRHAYFSLWQNDNTIVIGKNQNPHAEVNHEFVEKNNIKVARRSTGGGAVYHDLGNINFTFIVPQNEEFRYEFSKFTKPIITALESFGVSAKHEGRNDITIAGKKVSGNAQLVLNGKVLHHGTLLFDSNLEFINSCLIPNPIKLKSNGVDSIKSRMTNIKEYMPESIDVAQFKKRLLSFILDMYGCRIWRGLKSNELDEVQNLVEKKYSTWDWNYGASPKYNFHKEARIEKCGMINVYLVVEEGRILQCAICGDFFGIRDVSELQRQLIGARHERQEIMQILLDADVGQYIHNATAENVTSLFI